MEKREKRERERRKKKKRKMKENRMKRNEEIKIHPKKNVTTFDIKLQLSHSW